MKRSQIKRRPLADTVLAALEPEAKEFRELYGENLYFRVKPNGGKSWQLRYKKPGGSWAWLGLGGYPEVSAALAKSKAAEHRKLVSQGIDPLEQKRAAKAALEVARTRTFRSAAAGWLQSKTDQGLAKTTLEKMQTYLEKDILPALGDKLLDEITRNDCASLQASIEARGAHNVAEKCRSWLNQIFGRAIGLGLTENDPASRLRDIADAAPTTKQHPHLLEGELPDFIRALKNTTSRLPARTAAWLCIWTASRPGVVRFAEWSEFDLEAGVWMIPDEKMKMGRDHVSPLPLQAIAALKDLQRVTGRSRWLFPGVGPKNPMISENTINKVFAGIGYKGRLVGHGTRHTASTLLREHGWPKDHIEVQLAHKEAGVSGVYNKAQYLDKRSVMMQWYADYLDKLATTGN
ncbi:MULTISPECIES: tyrosine-type recombinase/integrase [Pseudomonas]|uniref:tyrosine-type recombinase/integrase n=1 Tax=Pseudomonas TaxID=286 RepID=UPI0012AE27F0|nr:MULTISPECIES: tyrosine-type recombinase/integrase [Pseudomonas]MCK2112457.1 tyrosine-type recombinase/integrase [Pseudomonas juntendi]MCK2116969.1 tyrosine-type recombinase/integrase [Pseudomonas juntendi]MDG9808465.1 tyrosine-type recombinase/integrase [Pseudomonas juntendi]MRT63217.1 tyrosine-type recombinase/integrase [Pseudomonas sp. CAH-1]